MINDLTFVVFTFNEAARLPGVIKNFQSYGRILVVDNFSTDETVAIARAAGCEILLHQNAGWVEDFETTEKVKSAVQTPWVYWAFADEILSPDVLEEIKRVIETDHCDVISLLRKNYYYGQFCYEVAAVYQTKAFKKKAVDFRGNTIHNFGRIIAPTGRIYRMPPDKFVHHLISNTASSYLNTINRYTDMEIASKPGGEMNKSILYYLLLPLKTLWQDFFRHGGRQAGLAGISLSVMMMTYSLIRAMKGYESVCGKDASEVCEANARVAARLLERFP